MLIQGEKNVSLDERILSFCPSVRRCFVGGGGGGGQQTQSDKT